LDKSDPTPSPSALHRGWALIALALAVAALALAVAAGVQRFPRGLLVPACVVAAAYAGGWGLFRRGAARTLAFTLAAGLLAAAVVFLVTDDRILTDALIIAAVALSLAAGRRAFSARAELPAAPRPQHAVLFYNPKSGGGKAARFAVADEARRRGIEPRELHPGDDLRTLVQAAIRDGADALAMAGGDGSQAIVAAEAAAHGLPYACIPAGTRNHFALDLGVDRNDVVGALDALVDGRERLVDLAEVNGQIFVNNVSLGVYADAVQQAGYREAKLRTLAQTASGMSDGDDDGSAFRWTAPDGREHGGAVALLVSNDRYRLGPGPASGTRPRLDEGVLGIAVFDVDAGQRTPPRIQQWSAPSFEVRAPGRLAAGVDGESMQFAAPLEFRSRPGALRVRIAQGHPGASPSAMVPETPAGLFRALLALAFGRPVRGRA
jgi:diacylglycerol kinase family enzyme